MRKLLAKKLRQSAKRVSTMYPNILDRRTFNNYYRYIKKQWVLTHGMKQATF